MLRYLLFLTEGEVNNLLLLLEKDSSALSRQARYKLKSTPGISNAQMKNINVVIGNTMDHHSIAMDVLRTHKAVDMVNDTWEEVYATFLKRRCK